LRLLTSPQVFGSALPPKVCVHPTVVRVHDGALAEEDVASSTYNFGNSRTLMITVTV